MLNITLADCDKNTVLYTADRALIKEWVAEKAPNEAITAMTLPQELIFSLYGDIQPSGERWNNLLTFYNSVMGQQQSYRGVQAILSFAATMGEIKFLGVPEWMDSIGNQLANKTTFKPTILNGSTLEKSLMSSPSTSPWDGRASIMSAITLAEQFILGYREKSRHKEKYAAAVDALNQSHHIVRVKSFKQNTKLTQADNSDKSYYKNSVTAWKR